MRTRESGKPPPTGETPAAAYPESRPLPDCRSPPATPQIPAPGIRSRRLALRLRAILLAPSGVLLTGAGRESQSRFESRGSACRAQSGNESNSEPTTFQNPEEPGHRCIAQPEAIARVNCEPIHESTTPPDQSAEPAPRSRKT